MEGGGVESREGTREHDDGVRVGFEFGAFE